MAFVSEYLKLRIGPSFWIERVCIFSGARPLQRFNDPDLWWLMAHRDLFTVTSRGLLELSNAFVIPRPVISSVGADESVAKSLDRARAIIQRLLESKQVQQLDERLREIDRDILGAYYFNRK